MKDMGTEEDMLNRIDKSRVDDKIRIEKIRKAREKIYRKVKPVAVTGDMVEEILKPESLVPTSAS